MPSLHLICCCNPYCEVDSSLSVQLTNFDGNLTAAAMTCTGFGPGGGGQKYTSITGVSGSYNLPVVIGMGGSPTCTYQDTFTLSGGLVRTNYNGTPPFCDGGVHSTETANQLTITVSLHDPAGGILSIGIEITNGTTLSEQVFSYTNAIAPGDMFPGDNIAANGSTVVNANATVNP